jgi:branched-chain amino acid transport system substrate-binding protein
MLVIDEIPDANPTKKVAQQYIARYEKQFGSKPATFGANTWDGGLLLQRAIPARSRRQAGHRGIPGGACATRSRRSATSSARRACSTCRPTNHNGMDERARVLVVVRDGKFRLLPE